MPARPRSNSFAATPTIAPPIPALPTSILERTRPQRSRAGGCDFAVDPDLPGALVQPVWLPRVDPRLPIFVELTGIVAMGPALDAAAPRALAAAAEGLYVELLALPASRQALLLRERGSGPVGVLLPLDALFGDRVETARRIYRLLTRGVAEPADFSRYRRERLKLALRALDGKLDGAGYREVARGLFPRLVDREREPSEAVTGRAIRLVRYGVELMHGGYLDLLRPERRAPRRPHHRT